MTDRQTNFILKSKDAASGPIAKVTQALRNAEKAARDLGGKALGGVATGISKVAKVAAVAAAGGILLLATGLGTAVVKAAAFEKAMLNVNSIAKATPAEFDKMRDSVLAISRDLPQSAETLAQGLYDIASSGFAGAEGITVLEAAAKAASAGLSTTAESAKGITAVLNAYHYGADKAQYVSDILFKTVDRGVITFGELAAQIGDVTSIAPLVGVSLEEVGAAMAVLTKNGINAAESATALSALLRSVLSPSEQAKDAAKELGLEWNVAALQAKGLNGFLADLIAVAGDDQEALAILAGDARAIKSTFILAADGGKAFTTELALMKDAAGATDTALSYQKQGLSFQLEILKNNISAAAIAIGEKLLPKITPLVTELSEFITALVDTDQPMKKLHGHLEESQEPLDKLTAKLDEWGPLGEIVGAVLYRMRQGFQLLKDIWTAIGPTVATVITKILGPGGLYESFQKIITQVVMWLIPKLKALATTLFGPGGVAESIGKVVTPIVRDLLPRLAGIVNALFGTANQQGLIPALGKLAGTLWGGGNGPLAIALKFSGAALGHLITLVTIAINIITWLIARVNDLARALNALPLIGGSQTFSEEFFGGGGSFAAGGPVSAKVPILVGEEGPEVFVPNSAGRIVPNDQLGGGVSGGSIAAGLTVIFQSMWPPSPQQAREFASVLSRELYYSQGGSGRLSRK